jgi:hypothetical protein
LLLGSRPSNNFNYFYGRRKREEKEFNMNPWLRSGGLRAGCYGRLFCVSKNIE